MLRNLNLYIDTGRKPIEIPVHIEKITDSKTTLNTIAHGRRIRTVTVLTHGDVEKVTKLEDIEQVVDRAGTVNGLEIQAPDGTRSIITIDKAVLNEGTITTATTRNLQVVAVVPSRTIKPYQYEGASYELILNGPTQKKVKVIDPQHTQMFNILYHGLSARDEMFIARYVSFGREKFAAIYAVDTNPVTGNQQNTLVMSNLIPSNYQRSFTGQHVTPWTTLETGLRTSIDPTVLKTLPGLDIPNCAAAINFFYQKMLKIVPTELHRETYFDRHEMKLKETVARLTSQVLKGEPICTDIEEPTPIKTVPMVTIPDHLKMLMDL
mgnify:CR=1 FL=1